jgi:hypothetical protein
LIANKPQKIVQVRNPSISAENRRFRKESALSLTSSKYFWPPKSLTGPGPSPYRSSRTRFVSFVTHGLAWSPVFVLFRSLYSFLLLHLNNNLQIATAF